MFLLHSSNEISTSWNLSGFQEWDKKPDLRKQWLVQIISWQSKKMYW